MRAVGALGRGAALLLRTAAAVAALVVRAGWQVVVRDPVLAAFVIAHPDGFLERLGAGDGADTLAGRELGADGGQALGAVAVLRELVGEAAHEPAAGARDLARVQRQLLLARHLERHGMEVLHPRRAAERPPARAAAVEALGLVADADLAQLDPGLEA